MITGSTTSGGERSGSQHGRQGPLSVAQVDVVLDKLRDDLEAEIRIVERQLRRHEPEKALVSLEAMRQSLFAHARAVRREVKAVRR